MEHSLRPLIHRRNEVLALARALLSSEQTQTSHAATLSAAFGIKPSARRLHELALQTHSWTATRPQPRLNVLVRKLQNDSQFRTLHKRHTITLPLVSAPPPLRAVSGVGALPALETVQALADWLRLDAEHLVWFADLHDRNRSLPASAVNHYDVRVLAKAYGSVRLLEAPKQRLKAIQRQILDEILGSVPLHSAVHGFRKNCSILTFVSPHVGREAILRVDLQDFFPSISGARVQALFRTLGYPEAVADLLGGLCTTTTRRRLWHSSNSELSVEQIRQARILYDRPHLPQGAPTSPALANLCCFRIDRRLAGLAKVAGAVYTRYADDLAFSGGKEFLRGADRFALHAAAVVAEEGFSVHHRKTRLMRPSVRQHLAGLTLNTHPNLKRQDVDRLKAVLTNCIRHGPHTQNRDQHPEFRKHLEGRVAFVAMINPRRAASLQTLLAGISWA